MKLIAFFAFALLAKDKICKALRFRKLTQILFIQKEHHLAMLFFGPYVNRTHNLPLRRRPLYPVELMDRFSKCLS